jgi:hypothetical protein
LPFRIPFTIHVTVVSVVFVTFAVNVARCVTATLALGGATLTLTELVIITVDDSIAVPSVAWTVTVAGDGKSAGAVYVAALGPLLPTVPNVALPPTTPSTSHWMVPPVTVQNDAVNTCVCPSKTLAFAGSREFALQVIVTLALPVFVASAMLVAIIVTLAGEGTTAGAVYVAPWFPFATIVPIVAFPPAIPFTVQVTAVFGFPVPVTVAAKTCAPPADTVAADGATLTEMSSVNVTLADELACSSATLVAVTVTRAVAGKIGGAA